MKLNPFAAQRQESHEGIAMENKLDSREEDGIRFDIQYRIKYAGCAALVVFNIVSAMNWVVFTTIATHTGNRFAISLDRVNWLSLVVCIAYLFTAPATPFLLARLGLRSLCIVAAGFLVAGSWLHYAGTASVGTGTAYAFLFLGSTCIGIAQSIFQIVPPTFAERWFQDRTTVIMLSAVANPFGGAIGDVLAPALVTKPEDIGFLLLVIGIISTAVFPLVFLIRSLPPTPPSKSAAERLTMGSGEIWQSIKVLLGLSRSEVERRDLIDFWIIAFLFSVLVGFFDAFLTLINQLFEPVGYSSDIAGYIGAATIFSGLIGALISAPLFDRMLKFRLALTTKILIPIIAISFFALPFVVRPNGLSGIYALCVLMGVAAFIMLPVALELAAEVVWRVASPDITSSILYFGGNGFSVVTILAMNDLRGPADGSPPYDMHRALLFQGIFVLVSSFAVTGLRGRQSRRAMDTGRN